jgi:type II secretory pathway pseudopilin PulG
MKKGFTIVELMIYMALLGGFLVILGSILLSVIDVQLETQAFSSVEQDGRYIMARLAYDIHRAQSITTPASAGQTASTLTLVTGGIPTTYSFSGGNLQLGADPLNSYDTIISGFSVTRLGDPTHWHSLQISLDLTGRSTPVSGLAQTKSYFSTVALRDK